MAHADIVFASHLCGLVKLDPAIFDLVVERLGRDPRDIYFFDDSSRNVAVARRAGMKAYETVGFEALVATITALGLQRGAPAAGESGWYRLSQIGDSGAALK